MLAEQTMFIRDLLFEQNLFVFEEFWEVLLTLVFGTSFTPLASG